MAWSCLIPCTDFLALTQHLLCSLQISIFVEPCDTPRSVQKALKSEKVEQMKVMQIQHKLCTDTQPHLFPLLTLRHRATEPHPSLRLTMDKPYDVHQQSLDIQRLRFGPGMATAVIVGQVRVEGLSR